VVGGGARQRGVGYADADRAQDALLLLSRAERNRSARAGLTPDGALIAASGCAASEEERDHGSEVQQQSRELPATASASLCTIFVIFVHSWSPRK
jgi:hypothetical protein